MLIKRVIRIELDEAHEPSLKELMDCLAGNRYIKYTIESEQQVPAVPLEPEKQEIFVLLEKWKKENALVRIKIVKGKGRLLDIAARVVGFDEDKGLVSLYDVDNKQVERAYINEIEDIIPNQA